MSCQSLGLRKHHPGGPNLHFSIQPIMLRSRSFVPLHKGQITGHAKELLPMTAVQQAFAALHSFNHSLHQPRQLRLGLAGDFENFGDVHRLQCIRQA